MDAPAGEAQMMSFGRLSWLQGLQHAHSEHPVAYGLLDAVDAAA